MPTPERLAEQFEAHRAHLHAVAYRMLGSASEAEDAVQESRIRLGRTDVSTVENLRAWLTTVVARVCLDMLRTRTTRREAPFDEHAEDGAHVPDPVISRADDPESNAILADSVGLALLILLEALEPAEEVKKLKQHSGKAMVLWGSLSLAQSLIDAALIDEYRLVVCPVVLGGGRALFREPGPSIAMKLQNARVMDRGAVVLRYVPSRET